MVKTKGSINIVVLSVLFIVLMNVAATLYVLNRLQGSNHLFYQQNSVRHLGMALEEKYVKLNEVGIFCGEINGKRYSVSVVEGEEGYKIFIQVENAKALYTLRLILDKEGNTLERLENIGKGEGLCW